MGFGARLAFIAGILPGLFYIGLTAAFRFGTIDFLDVYSRLSWLTPAMLGGAGVLMLAFIFALLSRRRGLAVAALLAAGASAALAYGPIKMKQISGSPDVPPIHDISTDVEDPPQFVATAPMREGLRNGPEYDRGQTAQQLKAYPDIVPIKVRAELPLAYDAAHEAAIKAGVRIVDTDPAEGRIEGTAVTFWFGFKDDVVIRLRAHDAGGTIVDIRSKSRIGRSDLGANANRIRKIRGNMLAILGEG